MLTENQTNRVWTNMYEAEVRSLYFGELANRFTKQKQVISGLSFFLPSCAAFAIVAHAPVAVSVALSLIVAILNTHSIFIGLDRKASLLLKLHSAWNTLQSEYESLWNHWFDDDATARLEQLLQRGHEISELGMETPWEPELIAQWQDCVNIQYEQQQTVA